mgnify:CR=1 FL=1
MIPPWSTQIEEEIALLLKDWLKQHGRTQAELRHKLQADSSRMSSLIEVLKKEYSLGGLPKLAARLCTIEKAWINSSSSLSNKGEEGEKPIDAFGQLDLLLEKIREDCEAEMS